MTSFQDQPPQSRRALRQERANSEEIDDSAVAAVRPSGRRARAAESDDATLVTGDLPTGDAPASAEPSSEPVDVAELPNATRVAHDDEPLDAHAEGDRPGDATELPDSAVPKAFPFAGQVEATSDDAGHPGFRLRDFSPELSTTRAESQSAHDWSPTTTGESVPLDYQTQGGPALGYVSPYAEPESARPESAQPESAQPESAQPADDAAADSADAAEEPSFDSLFSDLLAPEAAVDEPAARDETSPSEEHDSAGVPAAAVPVGEPIVVSEPVAPVEPVVVAQEERTMSRREWRAMRAKAEAEEASSGVDAQPARATETTAENTAADVAAPASDSAAPERDAAEPVSDLDVLFRQPEPAADEIPPLVEPEAAPHTPLSDAMAEFEALTRGGQSTVDTGSPSPFPSLFAEPSAASAAEQTTGEALPPVDASPFSAPAEPDIVRPAPAAAPAQPAPEQAAPDQAASSQAAARQADAETPAAAPREPFSFLLSPTSAPSTEQTDAAAYAPPVGHWSRQAQMDDESQPFENTLSRDVGGGNVATTTNALVLPMIPARDDFSSVLNATGEIMVTGTINLPGSVGSTGRDSRHYDDPEVDHLFDQFDAEVANTGSAPVRAITAVSSHTATRGGIETPRKQSNRMLNVLLVTACVMAVAVAGLLIAGFVFKIF